MQHYFCSPQGAAYLPSSEAIVPRLAALKLAFERAGLPVIFTQHGHGKDETDHPLLRWWTRDIVANTWEDELDSRLGPGPGSVVTRKDQYSAFRAPEFRKALARYGTRALVIGGVMTNLCCETTARDAFMEGFDVYFLADGTASKDLQSHLGTLRTIAYGFGYVATCEEVRACLP